MFTVRVVPPRWLWRAERADETFLDVYYRALWNHWRPDMRALACLIMLASTPMRIGRHWRSCWALNHPRNLHDATQKHMAAGARAEDFLWQPARKGVHRLLNPGAFPLSASPLKNKYLFAALCRSQNLSHPETLPAGASREDIVEFLHRHDAVILKPNFSSRGRGIEAWRWQTEQWDGPAHLSHNYLGMIDHVSQRLAAGYLVQRCLKVHPALATLSPGVLPSLRIITCRAEDGKPEATDAVLRLSAGGAQPVDNFAAGGIACVVNSDGQIERAMIRCAGGFETIDRHPESGAQLAGASLTDLPAALALAERAHAALGSGFTVVGWDVGMADEGPVLIEGNWNPGGETLQLPGGQGLAARRLGDLFRHHLQRLPCAIWRSAAPLQYEPR